MNIILFESKYLQDLKNLGQSLREYIVSQETRTDDLIIYNTDNEIDEYTRDNLDNKNIILLIEENDTIIGYGIWKIKEEDWEWTQIQKIGQIEQLFIDKTYRGKWFAQKLLQNFEDLFQKQWASHIEISVFALNTKAHEFYKKYGFEERLITLDKKII